MGQAVGAADDEVAEGIATVEVDGVAAGRGGRQRERLVVGLGGHRAGGIGDHELDLDRSAHHPGEGLADQGSVSVVEPVAGEAVRGGDAIAVLVEVDERRVLQPGLEVGRGEGDLQLAQDGTPYLLRIHR